MITKKVHFAAAIVTTLFIVFHLLNHAVSVFGADRHIEVMNWLRAVYLNPYAEKILLLAVAIQIVSGLRLLYGLAGKPKTKLECMQFLSGVYLAAFFLIHVSAVFFGRFFQHLDTNFYFGAAGLNTFPFSLFFIPYYGLAILSFFAHIAAVHAKKMKRRIYGLTPRQQSFIIFFSGLVVAILILYGLTDHFEGVLIPPEYEIRINRVSLSNAGKY